MHWPSTGHSGRGRGLITNFSGIMTTQGVELGAYFEGLVRSSKVFELVTPRSLALNVFRLRLPNSNGSAEETLVTTTRPTTTSSSQLNELNLELHRRITEGPDGIFITRTELNGNACLRMAIGGARTEEKHVREAFETFETKARALLSEKGISQ